MLTDNCAGRRQNVRLLHDSMVVLLTLRPQGDMKRPVCGLCRRVGSKCTFPLRQKPQKPRCRSKRSVKLTDAHPPLSRWWCSRDLLADTLAYNPGARDYQILNMELSDQVSDDDPMGKRNVTVPPPFVPNGTLQEGGLHPGTLPRQHKHKDLCRQVHVGLIHSRLTLYLWYHLKCP